MGKMDTKGVKITKRKVVVSLIVLVLVIAGVVAQVSGGLIWIEKKLGIYSVPEKPALTLDANLKSATPSYSLRYPKEWGTQQDNSISGVFTKELGADEAGQSVAGVLSRAWLLAEKKDSPFTEIIDLWRDKLELSYPGVEILEEKQFKINDKDAYYFEIKYSEGGNSSLQPNKAFRGRSYIVKDNTYLYQMLASSLESLWPMYKNTLIAIAESFKSP